MTPDLLKRCREFEICAIRKFGPTKYECDCGKVKHISSFDGREIIVDCELYLPMEIAMWRTDQMIPEYIEQRLKPPEIKQLSFPARVVEVTHNE